MIVLSVSFGDQPRVCANCDWPIYYVSTQTVDGRWVGWIHAGPMSLQEAIYCKKEKATPGALV